MSDPSPVRMTVKLKIFIENVYEGGPTITSTKDIEVPAPPNHDTETEAHEDWAYDHLFAETGTGRTEGDAGYFVKVLSADDPALVGNDYEWGV